MTKKIFKGRRKQFGGNGNTQSFHKTFQGKNFVFVGVDHTKTIPNDLSNEIIKFLTSKEKTCLLLELDYRIQPTNILRLKKEQINEPTVELLIRELNKLPKNYCIAGWDYRPSILTYAPNRENYQEALYGNYKDGSSKLIDLTLRDIYEVIINKIPNKKVLIPESQRNKYDSKTGQYLNSKYAEFTPEKYTKGLYDNLVQKLGGKDVWEKYKIRQLINSQEKNDLFYKLVVSLKDEFMKISDLHMLKAITQLDKRNYLIVVGMEHFNNIKKHMNN